MPIIHLADRDQAYRSRLAQALRQAQIDVMEFTSGTELYARTLKSPPDLVVMETDLEEVDGFQVFQWLNAGAPPGAAAVVFLTAFEHAGVALGCKERGARDFIGKAQALDQVVERLLAALGERDPLSGRSLGSALAWLQSRGKSGRIEVQACGRTGTILLHRGRVVGAHWAVWHGGDAVRLLTEVHSTSSLRFAGGVEEIVEASIPGMGEISEPLNLEGGARAVLPLPADEGGTPAVAREADEPWGTPTASHQGRSGNQARMATSLIAASVAIMLAGGLTFARFFDRPEAHAGNGAPEVAAARESGPASPIPPPLSIADAGHVGAVTSEPQPEPQPEPKPEPKLELKPELQPLEPPAAAAEALAAPASLDEAPAVAEPTPSTRVAKPSGEVGRLRAEAPSPRRINREASPQQLTAPPGGEVVTDAPGEIVEPPTPPRQALVRVEEEREAEYANQPAAPDPVGLARREVEVRRLELARIERMARATRLDARPVPKQPLRFRYPRDLTSGRVRGSLELLVNVDATGAITEARVLESSGSEKLDAAAVEAVRRSSYEPPRRDGRAVSAWIRQPMVGMCCRGDAAPSTGGSR